MATGTLTYAGRLVVTSCWCGIGHAVPKDLYNEAARNHSKAVYCPLGHTWVVAGETEAAKERRLRKWAEDQAASERARADQATASLRTTKGHLTRMKRRAMAGACPFGCHRTFADLQRHVVTKHPDETVETAGE